MRTPEYAKQLPIEWNIWNVFHWIVGLKFVPVAVIRRLFRSIDMIACIQSSTNVCRLLASTNAKRFSDISNDNRNCSTTVAFFIRIARPFHIRSIFQHTCTGFVVYRSFGCLYWVNTRALWPIYHWIIYRQYMLSSSHLYVEFKPPIGFFNCLNIWFFIFLTTKLFVAALPPKQSFESPCWKCNSFLCKYLLPMEISTEL